MRIAYVTSSLPQGPREAFLLPEITRLIELGHDVTVVPTRPIGPIVHRECKETIARHTVCIRPAAMPVLVAAFAELVASPRATTHAALVVARSRSLRVFMKNIAVLPKALWLARWARRQGIQHIHAGWMSTPATVALIASEATGIPWSGTAHRWDIRENNLLARKTRSAVVVRAISRRGRSEIAAICGSAERISLIRLGIKVPSFPGLRPLIRENRILVAGNLIPLKGHRYLLEAIAGLRDTGIDVALDVVGDGPLRRDLVSYAVTTGIAESVTFHGQVDHDRLLGDLARGRWALLVVPSIVDAHGATEGVPVIILEAMARGVAVIASDVGAISEAAGNGAAVLVPQRDVTALRDAIRALLTRPDERSRIAEAAYGRVRREFDVVAVVDSLLSIVGGAAETADVPPPGPVPVLASTR